MVDLDLQKFAKTASQMAAYRASIRMAKNQMPGPAPKEKSEPKESQEDIAKRITGVHGNVTSIENGQRYNIYTVNKSGEEELYSDRWDATDTKDFLETEHYTLDRETGTYKNRSGNSIRIKLVKKRK